MVNTYEYLINIKYKTSAFLIIIVLSIIVCLTSSVFLKTYDKYNAYGIYKNGYLYVDLDIENSDAITKSKYMRIDSKKYSFEIIDISDLLENKKTNYQEYALKIKKLKCKDNQVIKVTIYYNEERIIKKIKKAIF